MDAFPRLHFKEELLNIICGLCRDKPDTTMDNMVLGFGSLYGIDWKGAGKGDFAQRVLKKSTAYRIFDNLTTCAAYE